MSGGEDLRLLFVEDCRADAELCVRELECSGFHVEWDIVDRAEDVVSSLDCEHFDLAVLDYGLPGWSGFDALQLVLQLRDIPVILVTGSLGDEVAVDCIHAGASDYVLKNNLVRLAPAVRRALEAHALRRERRQAEEALARAHAELEQRVAERTADLARLNQELATARAEWERIFNCMSDAVTYQDSDYRILRSNRAFREMFPGLTTENLRCYEVFHGSDHPLDICPMAKTLASGQTESCEIFEPRTRRHLQIRTDPVTGASGEIVRIVHIVSDITERKTNDELRERLAAILQATTALVATADRDGLIVYLNRAGRRMLRIDDDAFEPLHIGDFYPGWKQHLEAHEIAGNDAAWSQETSLRRRDGSELPVLLVTVFHRRHETAGEYFSLVAHDITQRKEIERMKDDLVSTVSHELRTPLASMLGFTELLLQRDYSPEKQREFIGIIHAETQRLAELVNNFLDLQRIESGRPAYNFERCDLAPILRECAAVFETADQQHRFTLEFPEKLPAVTVDHARMHQVLNNLLSNAVKYSPDGGAIRLGARAEANRLLLWVADPGIGISADEMPRLFTRFFRGENAARRGIRGSGLGLALCREIVRSMNGQIWAESGAERGATFYIVLPLAGAHTQHAGGVVS